MLALPGSDNELSGGFTDLMVRFAARFEYAKTTEDVLARRSRLLFLDAALAKSLSEWQAFFAKKPRLTLR